MTLNPSSAMQVRANPNQTAEIESLSGNKPQNEE